MPHTDAEVAGIVTAAQSDLAKERSSNAAAQKQNNEQVIALQAENAALKAQLAAQQVSDASFGAIQGLATTIHDTPAGVPASITISEA